MENIHFYVLNKSMYKLNTLKKNYFVLLIKMSNDYGTYKTSFNRRIKKRTDRKSVV